MGAPGLAQPANLRGSTVLPETAYSAATQLTQRRTSPPVPPLPATIPAAILPEADGIVGLYPEPSDDIGVAHLRPREVPTPETTTPDGFSYAGAGWLQAAALPIYVSPEGNHWGWLMNGWLVPNGQSPLAIGRDATFLMLHTHDTLFSFPVTEIREDGWFRLQYTPAGTAWAHLDHLNLGGVDLVVERWEDRFEQTELIFFRQNGISRPFYGTPSSPTILGLVGPNSAINPVTIEGDWMQVRITQPTNGCEQLPGARTQEGWIRWRDRDEKLLVWSPPEGC